MEIILTNHIESNLKVKRFLEKEKINIKYKYVETDYSAYIDFMHCKAKKLPVIIKDGYYIQSSDIKEIKDFIRGKTQGEFLK